MSGGVNDLNNHGLMNVWNQSKWDTTNLPEVNSLYCDIDSQINEIVAHQYQFGY